MDRAIARIVHLFVQSVDARLGLDSIFGRKSVGGWLDTPQVILARKRRNRWLLGAVLVCLALMIGFGLWVSFRLGGVQLTEWIDDLGEAAAALVAAVVCLVAAWRHAGRFRAAWALIGGSALTWFCGEAVWSYYELGLGQQVPFPSAADAGFLGAVPLAIAGVLLFTGTQILQPGTTQKRRRAITAITFATVLDGAIIAGSLIAVSWVTVLEPIFMAGGDTLFSTLLSLAYPISDIVILTMLLLLLGSRQNAPDRIRLLLLSAGLLANLLADSGFAYLTATKGYGPAQPIDTGWVAGYLLIALAGLRASLMPVSSAHSQDQRMARWRLLLPYLPVAGAVVASLTDTVLTGSVDKFLFYDLTAVVVLVAVRQFLMLAENVGLNVALKEQTAALQKREEQLRSLVEHSSDAATLADREGVIQFQSGSVQRMFAYASGELVGTRLADLVFPADRPALDECLADALKASARPKSVRCRLKHKLGSWSDCEVTITNLLYLPSVEALVINVRDISDRKLLEEKVSHQADHDELTNLANRSAFRRALEQALGGAELRVTVLLIDVDDFRAINTELGSEVGDQLLVAVGARLEQNTPPGALLARLRSDEFAILLPATPIEDAAPIADSILQQFRAPFLAVEREVSLPVTIGGAGVMSGHESATELLRNADVALEAAKASGKARYQRYAPKARETGRAEAA